MNDTPEGVFDMLEYFKEETEIDIEDIIDDGIFDKTEIDEDPETKQDYDLYKEYINNPDRENMDENEEVLIREAAFEEAVFNYDE